MFDGQTGRDTLVAGSKSRWDDGAPNYIDAAIRQVEILRILPTHQASRSATEFWEYDIDHYAKRGARFSIDQLESFEAIGKSNDISWGNELQTFNSSELRDWVDNDDKNSSWRSLRIAGEGTVDLTAERWDSTTFFNIYTSNTDWNI